jgi:hypothetical protein
MEIHEQVETSQLYLIVLCFALYVSRSATRVSNLPNRCRNSASRRFSMLSERSRTSASNWSLTKLHSSTGLLDLRLALSPLLALSLQSF